ncbi:hypothetical protein BDZ45DRAFT_744992 [Acephala macrosclerotiorum]|nr:hypothetical protein BDZ45DRAFT_744992 [Acephala macrosclerotiorum]
MDKHASEANHGIPQAQIDGGQDCKVRKSKHQVCKAKLASCYSKAKTLTRKKSPAQISFPFHRLPDELQLKIISFALGNWNRQRIILSRQPYTIANELEDGVYCRPHPFLTVSVKFRQMPMIATSPIEPSFAVLRTNGEEVNPPRTLRNFEKDRVMISQSVLDYEPELIIPDLMRVKRLYVLCRRTLGQVAIRRICKFPVNTKILFIHDELLRSWIGKPTYQYWLHDPSYPQCVLSKEEQEIHGHLFEQTSLYKRSHDLSSGPKLRWYAPKRFSNDVITSSRMKAAKDSITIKLRTEYFARSPNWQAWQRDHWAR